ncbi:hypothetical protein Y032_0568g49 [Ancylostoma ceylanicum]|uniref:Uncharacterized protein n=1 Tax=Ancylostoma ceylanicum TaxID=53326 RepID=A0A016WR07_9BILA|nr:hypothetical protein Y032_0568g49 [Ancylostoma ceylanicum]
MIQPCWAKIQAQQGAMQFPLVVISPVKRSPSSRRGKHLTSADYAELLYLTAVFSRVPSESCGTKTSETKNAN